MSYKILVINPGSTSTKIGVFEDEQLIFEETLRHSTQEIGQYATIFDQKDFRREVIQKVLKEKKFDIHTLDVVVGRGGLLKPIPGGTYPTTPQLLEDLRIGVQGAHASNLGGIIAHEIAEEVGGIPSYIVDPVVVDEFQPVARISGHPDAPRTSIFHALNSKAIGRRYGKDQGTEYNQLNLVIAHLGGGVTVGAHKKGRVVDVFNAMDSDGAFSPERTGGLPVRSVIQMCFSGKYATKEDLIKAVNGKGGITAYLGTNDMRDVEKMVEEGNAEAKLILDAFIYQVAKDIGAMATVLEGEVDQVLLTGGIAYSQYVRDELKRKTAFIAPMTAYPGEDELLALAQGAIAVLSGKEPAGQY
ncbi:MAG: butyrate kinase [Lachnospiraceae bacterium]